ncbi:hypothetical protein SDC9_83447 [bioreactor metagenome]|uniref:NAD-specific glutamate dehydrogenase n=1 Tax=bioreactor metagenome TaxID=1076179 RepID=A0A644ZDR0_9ZZZZ
MQHQEARDLRVGHAGLAREILVDLADAVGDQGDHLFLGGQIDVAAIRHALALGPVAHGFVVDVDERADLIALVAKAHSLFDLREELELVLDIVRCKHGAGVGLADVLGAVDDAQVAIGVQHPRIAGVEVAVGIDHFGGGVGALVVFLQHRHALDQHFAVVCDLQFNAGRGAAHAVELDGAVTLNADIGAGFGLAVELLQVDADGAEKTEQIRANGRTGGVGHANFRQAHHIAQRAVDQDVAQLVLQPIHCAHGLAVENVGAHAARQFHAFFEQPALGLCRVFHADRHRGEHAFEHARRCEIVGGADLAQVDVDRGGRFGTVDGEACGQPLREREQMVAHPCRWQVGDDVVFGVELIHLDRALGRSGKAGVRLAHALGCAGGARGVQNHRDVGRLDAFDQLFPCAGMLLVPLHAFLHQIFGADEAGRIVLAQAARVVIDDVADRRHGLAHFKQLVDLFLVFGEGEGDFRILHHEGHFAGDGVLVQRNRHAANALHGHEAQIQVRTVVADEREVLAALESQCQQPAGHLAHVACGLAPAPGLPDAILFLAQGWCVRSFGGVSQQQMGERCLHSCTYPVGEQMGLLQIAMSVSIKMLRMVEKTLTSMCLAADNFRVSPHGCNPAV